LPNQGVQVLTNLPFVETRGAKLESNNMKGLHHWLSRFTCLSGVGFSLAGLVLCAGCSTGPLMQRTWTCDQEADRVMGRQDYEGGIVLHKRVLKEVPDNGLAWYHLGYAYGQTGDLAKEVSCYEKAVGLGFQGGQIFFNLGMAYGELSEIDKSIRAFKKAVEKDPGSADNYFGLGMAYRRNLDDKRAEKEFMKALRIDPSHLEARLHLSMLYMDKGDLQKARDQLRKVLEIDPTHRVARESLKSIQGQ
jgi:Tfp pilus assembly protein PilF